MKMRWSSMKIGKILCRSRRSASWRETRTSPMMFLASSPPWWSQPTRFLKQIELLMLLDNVIELLITNKVGDRELDTRRLEFQFSRRQLFSFNHCRTLGILLLEVMRRIPETQSAVISTTFVFSDALLHTCCNVPRSISLTFHRSCP